MLHGSVRDRFLLVPKTFVSYAIASRLCSPDLGAKWKARKVLNRDPPSYALRTDADVGEGEGITQRAYIALPKYSFLVAREMMKVHKNFVGLLECNLHVLEFRFLNPDFPRILACRIRPPKISNSRWQILFRSVRLRFGCI